MFSQLFKRSTKKKHASSSPSLTSAGMSQVTSDFSRCVQCGICGFNCPVGIEVREYARRGENVMDSRCIGCGACIEKCPRGTLRWGPAMLLRDDNTIGISADALPEMLRLQPRDLN